MNSTAKSSYLDGDELLSVGFKSCGTIVFVSRKTSIYNAASIELGSHVRIDDFCILSGGSGLKIGNYVHIASYCGLFAGSGITMEDFSGLSARVTLYSESDDFSGQSLTNPTVPDEYKPGYKKGPILVGRHVIVGANTTILPGVTLGEGSAVGAHSMVSKNCKAWSIYSGAPAKYIRERQRQLLDLEQKLLALESSGLSASC
jgi:dTDP-4-amino-4,6-dideoxy-D-glucose acyltransferase